MVKLGSRKLGPRSSRMSNIPRCRASGLLSRLKSRRQRAPPPRYPLPQMPMCYGIVSFSGGKYVGKLVLLRKSCVDYPFPHASAWLRHRQPATDVVSGAPTPRARPLSMVFDPRQCWIVRPISGPFLPPYPVNIPYVKHSIHAARRRHKVKA
jgi:hypothetical protein